MVKPLLCACGTLTIELEIHKSVTSSGQAIWPTKKYLANFGNMIRPRQNNPARHRTMDDIQEAVQRTRLIDATNSRRKKYSGTSLIRSPMGLGKSDLNGEVTVLQFTGG